MGFISERKITTEEGEGYLKEFGYNLHVKKNPETGVEEIRATYSKEENNVVQQNELLPVKNEGEKKQDDLEENDTTILRKELALGKELLKKHH